MATRMTQDKDAQCTDRHHSRSHGPHSNGITNLAETKVKAKSTWAHLIEDSIATAYNKDHLPLLLTPDANADLTAIQEAFIGTNSQLTTARSDAPQNTTPSPIKEGVAKFDPRFQIGFSRFYGHAVELTRDTDKSKDGQVIPSGTYIFQSSEMPYACIVQEPWRGKVCEECLRLLPKDPRDAFVCPACPDPTPEQLAQLKAQPDASQQRSEEPVFVKAPYQPARFCTRECLRTAWKAWHGYECGHADILQEVPTNKRLALRAYWRNLQRMIKVAPPSASTSKTAKSTAGQGSSTTKRPASVSASTSASLSDIKPGGLTFDNERRIKGTDGSDIRLDQLCNNFTKLEKTERTAFMIVGYYFQQAMDLPDDAAMEIAYLLAITMFNAFAVKSHSHGREKDAQVLRHMHESTIGMALYLKASMFNHSCAPNAIAVFGCTDPQNLTDICPEQPKYSQQEPDSTQCVSSKKGPDPRSINVMTTKAIKVDKDVPVLMEISYGPQVGRMPTRQRQLYLKTNHHFECNCTACNDRFAETVHRRVYKCPKNGVSCRSLAEDEIACPTCGAEVNFELRFKLHKLIVRLVQDSEDPTLTPAKRFKILQTLEKSQSKVFVNTHILYGNTCDRLAQAYAEAGDLPKSIEWCTKAHKVILVHFPHDSIEVAQETLKLAGLLFNNSQPKEALKHVKTAIGLYKGHYGATSTHPDLVELYEMEKILVPIVEGSNK
ncbi:SET and MYND domain-containing protein 4 [Podila epicladia]|nr:SET and MYND domain-containing protein 4 [Podila epicladia]KAG0097279.1 SET and MYND domain-containing protein 4 [Podila epicladia]